MIEVPAAGSGLVNHFSACARPPELPLGPAPRARREGAQMHCANPQVSCRVLAGVDRLRNKRTLKTAALVRETAWFALVQQPRAALWLQAVLATGCWSPTANTHSSWFRRLEVQGHGASMRVMVKAGR